MTTTTSTTTIELTVLMWPLVLLVGEDLAAGDLVEDVLVLVVAC